MYNYDGQYATDHIYPMIRVVVLHFIHVSLNIKYKIV